MSIMQATNLPKETNTPKGADTPAFLNTPQRRRVTEAEMGHAIANWFAGEPWPLEDAQWVHQGRTAVRLRDLGDRLVVKGVVIATRNPVSVADAVPGTNLAHLSEARAVARVALRGDHVRLYGAQVGK